MKKIFFTVIILSTFFSYTFSQIATITTTPTLAGDTVFICDGNQIDFIGSTTGGTAPYTYAWSFGDGTTSTQQNPNHNFAMYGLYEVNLISTDNNSNQNTNTARIWVRVYETPTINLGVNDTVGGNMYIFNGSFSGLGNTGYWTGPTGTFFSDINNPTTQASILLYNYNSFTGSFIWTESNQNCTNSDTIEITFYNIPVANANLAIGQSSITCDTIAHLFADTVNAHIESGLWYADPSSGVTFDDELANATSVNVSGINYGATSQTNIVFYWKAINGCCYDTDSVIITFFETPIANAGKDTSICGWTYTGVGNYSIANSTGSWSQISGPSMAVFSDITDPHSHIYSPYEGQYVLQWIEWNINNTNCVSRDTILIHFNEIPTVDAGTNISACGGWAQLNALPSVGQGRWIYPSGIGFSNSINGTINNAMYDTLPNACINIPSTSSLFNQQIALIWRETNGHCITQDTVFVVFWDEIIAELIDTSMGIPECGNWSKQLKAVPPTLGTGTWVDAFDMPSFLPNENTPIIDTVIINYYGMHEFYWVVENGACIDSSEVKYIEFFERPVANAGVSDTVCSHTYALNAISSLIPGVSGEWRISSMGGSFFWSTGTCCSTSPIDTVTALLGTYELIWFEQVDSLLGCGDVDTITILFAGQPTGLIIDTINPLCVGEPFELVVDSMYANPNRFYWTLDYGMTGVIDTITYGASHPLLTWPNISQAGHNVELFTQNMFGCKSPVSTITLFDPPALDPTITIDTPTSGNAAGAIYLNKYLNSNYPNYYEFKWIDKLNDGSWMFPMNINYNLPSTDTAQTDLFAGNYLVVVHGLQRANPLLTYQYTCYDTLNIPLYNVGVETVDVNQSFNIYPNPSSRFVQIESKIFNVESYSVLDIYGKTIQEFKTHNSEFRINIEDLSKGIYFIRLQTEKGVVIKKFIKQ